MKKNLHIVIVGAGTGGIIALARIHKILPNSKITIIAPNKKHIYQPGQIFVASGLYQENEIVKSTQTFIPKGVDWIREEVIKFEPKNSSVVIENGKKIELTTLNNS